MELTLALRLLIIARNTLPPTGNQPSLAPVHDLSHVRHDLLLRGMNCSVSLSADAFIEALLNCRVI